MTGARIDSIRLGLQANWQQFTLLVVINAFVGAMVGLERAILPLLGEQDFGLTSRTVILSFIVTFGVVKALANLFAGRMSDRIGRKRILVTGWFFGLPVPLLIMFAPSWSWVVAANILLGINQGLCWSTTVIMKIDLVGPARRGLAMGFNEFAGYVAVSLAALASGYLAATYALRPQPFFLGVVFALAGLLLSVLFVRESHGHARVEAQQLASDGGQPPSFGRIFLLVSWRDNALFTTSQAGLVNNLNDGMAWCLFPLVFAAGGLGVEQVGLLAAIYPGVWGVAQLATGALSDRLGRKGMIVGGMWLQAVAILLVVAGNGFLLWRRLWHSSDWGPPSSIRRCSPPFRTSRTLTGAHPRSASIGCGGMAATQLARSWRVRWPTCLACRLPLLQLGSLLSPQAPSCLSGCTRRCRDASNRSLLMLLCRSRADDRHRGSGG